MEGPVVLIYTYIYRERERSTVITVFIFNLNLNLILNLNLNLRLTLEAVGGKSMPAADDESSAGATSWGSLGDSVDDETSVSVAAGGLWDGRRRRDLFRRAVTGSLGGPSTTRTPRTGESVGMPVDDENSARAGGGGGSDGLGGAGGRVGRAGRTRGGTLNQP